MSVPKTKQRIQLPDILRGIISEFTIAYVLEQPSNLIDFAAEYFAKLQQKHRQQNDAEYNENEISSQKSILDEEPMLPPQCLNRRKAVFAEDYDPEKDPDDDEGAMAITPKTDEQRARLTEAVKNIILFRSLDADQMNQVLNAMFEKTVKPNEFIIRQGDDGDNFYVIESGIYKAFVDGKHIHTYDGEGYFGELALLYNMPRAATIQAETDGRLWAMDRQTFQRILKKSAFKKREMYETLLDSVPMLKTLKSYERMNLADALISKVYKNGDKIIGQGDVADGMYLIEEGEVSIIQMDEGGKFVEQTKLSKGQYFGESALVTRKPRDESAYAISDEVKVAFLDVEAFERLLGPCMDITKPNKRFSLISKHFKIRKPKKEQKDQE